MALRFKIPQIDENLDGWGPSSASVPEKYKEVPYYAPFNKGEKLGKAADWQAQYQGKPRYGQKDTSSGVSTIFNWYYQDDDTSFTLVDNTKTQQRKMYGPAKRYQKFQQGGMRQQRNVTQQAWQQQNSKFQPTQNKKQPNKSFFVRPGFRQDGRKREASIQVKDDWTLIEEIEFNTLTKISDNSEPQPEDIMSCGSLEYYNKGFDRITTKSDSILERTDRIFFNVTTSDDPVIRQLSMENAGTVFATDVILSHLMCCTRSVAPWDIIITKAGSKLFLDKRDGSSFDFLTVNETSAEPPVDDPRDPINSASALTREAMFINHNFSQQVLTKGETLQVGNPNPFQSEGQDVAAVAYRYRKWKLDNDLVLVARCELDGVASSKGKDSYLTIKSLNEFDPKSTGDWRKKIDAQRTAVLATELKNNSHKLAKWTAQALLAGTETMKLGYVSRISPKDLANHQILAVQDYKPKEFAQQISLNTKNMWAILKRVIDLCMKQPTGKYILVKDPEKSGVRLYKVPQDAFDSATADDENKESESTQE